MKTAIASLALLILASGALAAKPARTAGRAASKPAVTGNVAAASAVAASKPSSQATSVPAYIDPSGGQVMATVNGVPISMGEINEILLYSYGLPVAQQLIANELVRQEAARLNVTASPEEDVRQHQQTLAGLFPTVEADQRERTFEQFLVEKSITRKQWDFTMHRMSLLAKLAEPRIKIAEEDLQQAFGDRYGRKVVVRHIELATLTEAQDALGKLEKGADFSEMVQKRSLSPTRTMGGLLSPLSAATKGFPPGLKDAAMALTKVGQYSQVVQVGTRFHVLKLDQIIPPQDVKYADVRDKLKNDVHAERLQMMQQQTLMELIRDAQLKGSVSFKNPILRQLWETASPENGPQ